MLSFFDVAVDALDDDALCAFISKEQPFMEFSRDIVDALVIAEDSLRDSLADLSDETFHIQIFQDTADYGMCEQVRGRQRKHQARSDICNCLVEVRRVLQIALAERANVKE